MMEARNTVASEAVPQTIDRILLAAETEFAERGFDGASMKAISVRADVSQALLHYHFGTKDHLYAEVIRRRSKMINDERLALLEQVDMGASDAIDRVLEALFRPPLGPMGGEKPYARIFSGLVVGREREQALVRECYDPTARRFIAAIQTAIPGIGQGTAAVCYTLALGALITVIGRDGRLERLMEASTLTETEDMLRDLVSFAKGGIGALAQETSM